MIRCKLFGHAFTITLIGGSCIRHCARCQKSYILVERTSAFGTSVLECFWREMRVEKQGGQA